MNNPNILIAGMGNIFMGDDGFGVEVAGRLRGQTLPDGVSVVEFGIRSFDLAFALVDGYQAVILVDALQRNEPPGTLYVLEPDLAILEELSPVAIEGHSLHPAQVLKLAHLYGNMPERILLVGCEPATLETSDGQIGLSPEVNASVSKAIEMVQSLVASLVHTEPEVHG